MNTLQSGPTHPLVEPSEIKCHDGDLVSGLTSEARELAEVERLPDSEPGTLGGPDVVHTKDHKSVSQAKVGQVMVHLGSRQLSLLYPLVLGCFVSKVGCSPAERQSRVRERQELSETDRERTMRNLVDVQRKVELRHRRDRERQMLRVSGNKL